jgi:uncharacterized protein (DUF1330 family)
MIAKLKFGLALLIGAGLGGAAVQRLDAQAAPKAYTVIELETLDGAAVPPYVRAVEAAQDAAGAHNFNTGGGRIVAMVGAAPKRVVILEWNSLEQGQAFYNSSAWNDLAAQRDKAFKTIRQYTVEARK